MRVRASCSLRSRLGPLVLVLALPLVACGDDDTSGPNGGPDSDIKDIATALAQGKADVLDDNPQVASAVGLKADIVVVTQALNPRPTFDLRSSRQAALSLASTGAGAFLVPPGVTCIWSLQQNKYVGDPDDPGLAPPEGIRFRLYDLDPNLRPVSPLDDIGLVDVVPRRGANNPDLVDVKIDSEDEGGEKALSVDLGGSVTDTGASLSKTASASANNKTLSWTYDIDASASQLNTDLKATLLDIAADMVETVTSDNSSDLMAEVRARGKTIVFSAALNGSTIESGSITVNGAEVGQLSGFRGGAVVTGTQQNADFAAIFDAVTEVDLFALEMTNYSLDSLPPRDSGAQGSIREGKATL